MTGAGGGGKRPGTEGARGLSRRARRSAGKLAGRLACRWTPSWALRLRALGLCELDRDALGRIGEAIAARALRRAGWRVVGRRLRTPLAELDLVVSAPGWLVAVEVKTGGRALGPGSWRPGHRLDHRPLARQERAAAWLAARLRGRGGTDSAPAWRVDLIEIEIAEGGKVFLHHWPDLRQPAPR